MKHFVPIAAALFLATAAGAQTTVPTSTDQTTQAAQTTGDPTTAPAQTPAPNATPVKPTVGAIVYGSGGTPVGTIKSMDAQFVTLTTPKGDIRLPAAGVGAGPNGPMVAMTADQLNAAIDQAKATQSVATSKTTSAETTSDAAGTTTTTKTKTKTRSRR